MHVTHFSHILPHVHLPWRSVKSTSHDEADPGMYTRYFAGPIWSASYRLESSRDCETCSATTGTKAVGRGSACLAALICANRREKIAATFSSTLRKNTNLGRPLQGLVTLFHDSIA